MILARVSPVTTLSAIVWSEWWSLWLQFFSSGPLSHQSILLVTSPSCWWTLIKWIQVNEGSIYCKIMQWFNQRKQLDVCLANLSVVQAFMICWSNESKHSWLLIMLGLYESPNYMILAIGHPKKKKEDSSYPLQLTIDNWTLKRRWPESYPLGRSDWIATHPWVGQWYEYLSLMSWGA